MEKIPSKLVILPLIVIPAGKDAMTEISLECGEEKRALYQTYMNALISWHTIRMKHQRCEPSAGA